MLERVVLDDPKAAGVLRHRRQRRILLSLIEDERSASELAGLTDTPLNLLHHHLGKFLRLGLVVVARTRPRAGAAIKFYRATAKTFFVPAEFMAALPVDELNGRLREALDRQLAGAIQGVTYSSEGGRPRMRLMKTAIGAGFTDELWLELRLNRADATALAGELRATLKRYEGRSNKANGGYIVHAAIAPR
ncbi:MAG TPA: winged helix-turn-helix domain-containing protein [Caulobacteraceae bacterium]